MPRKTRQNSITSPELLGRVNPKNIKLLDEYVAYMRSVQRSEKTIAGYVSDLRIFFVWLLENADNKFFIDINKRDIIRYQAYLSGQNQNSPARIRRLKSTLSALSNYVTDLCDDLYPNFKNIISKVENPPNEPVREKTILSNEQLQELLDKLVERSEYQKACMLSLAMNCGARKSELVRFKVDFFVDENLIFGSMWKTPKIKTKGRGLGKFIPKYVFKKEFEPYLKMWMDERTKLGIESEWLFVFKNQAGYWEQLKADTLNSWAVTFSNLLDVDFYWHLVRHTWTCELVKKNLPTNVIKSLQNWESEDMVALYSSDISDEDLFSKYFDENGIKEVKKTGLSDL